MAHKSVDVGEEGLGCAGAASTSAGWLADPSSKLSSLKRGNCTTDRASVEGNAAEHLFDAAETRCRHRPTRPRRESVRSYAGPSPDDPLKLYVRQIGDGRC